MDKAKDIYIRAAVEGALLSTIMQLTDRRYRLAQIRFETLTVLAMFAKDGHIDEHKGYLPLKQAVLEQLIAEDRSGDLGLDRFERTEDWNRALISYEAHIDADLRECLFPLCVKHDQLAQKEMWDLLRHQLRIPKSHPSQMPALTVAAIAPSALAQWRAGDYALAIEYI